MRLIVADASAIVDFLFRGRRAALLDALVAEPDVALHVPALCDVEITSVLRRTLNSKAISDQRAADALTDYLDLPLARHGHVAGMTRALQLRANFGAYDATYVALAERLAATFVTADDALARAVRNHTSLNVMS